MEYTTYKNLYTNSDIDVAIYGPADFLIDPDDILEDTKGDYYLGIRCSDGESIILLKFKLDGVDRYTVSSLNDLYKNPIESGWARGEDS